MGLKFVIKATTACFNIFIIFLLLLFLQTNKTSNMKKKKVTNMNSTTKWYDDNLLSIKILLF